MDTMTRNFSCNFAHGSIEIQMDVHGPATDDPDFELALDDVFREVTNEFHRLIPLVNRTVRNLDDVDLTTSELNLGQLIFLDHMVVFTATVALRKQLPNMVIAALCSTIIHGVISSIYHTISRETCKLVEQENGIIIGGGNIVQALTHLFGGNATIMGFGAPDPDESSHQGAHAGAYV